MEIRYTNTKEDMKPFLVKQKSSDKTFNDELKSARKMNLTIAVVVAVIGIFNLYQYFVMYEGAEAYVKKMVNGFSFISCGIISALTTFMLKPIKAFFVKMNVNSYLKKMNREMDEVTLNIDDNSIRYVMGKEKGFQKMTEKFDVEETDKAYYVYLKKEVLLVPKRIFGKDEEKQFRKLLRIK